MITFLYKVKAILFLAFTIILSPPLLHSQASSEIDSISKEIYNLRMESGLYMISDQDRCLNILNEAVYLAQQYEMWYELISIHQKNRLVTFAIQNQMERWKKELLTIDSLLLKYSQDLGKSYNLLGIQNLSEWGKYYIELGFEKKGLAQFRQAMNQLEALPRDSASTYNLHHNALWLGSYYKNIGSYVASISENKRAILLLEDYKSHAKGAEKISKTGIYTSIASAYLSLGDTNQAMFYFKEAEKELTRLAQYDPKKDRKLELMNIYSGKTEYFRQIEQYDLCLDMLKTIYANTGANDKLHLRSLIKIGDVFVEKEEFEKALDCYEKAKRIIIEKAGLKNVKAANSNLKIAELYKRKGDYPKALKHFQHSIYNVLVEFKDTSNYKIHPKEITLNKVLGRTGLLKALAGKAVVLEKMYSSSGNIEFLKHAQLSNNLAVTLIDSIKNNLFLYDDRQFQMALHYPIFEKGLQIAYQLHEASYAPKDQLERILKLTERSKGLALSETFHTSPTSNPEAVSFIEQEKQLDLAIAARINKLLNTEIDPNKDSLYLNLQYRKSQWIEKAKSIVPNYIQLKYNFESIPLASIQKDLLKKDQLFIEYFWGKEELFTIAISGHKAKIYRQPINNLADSIQLFYDMASDKTWQTRVKENIRFQQLSHFIYQQLLQPIFNEFPVHLTRLMVVRDGPLNHLPFDILNTSSEAKGGILKIENLLAMQQSVSYAYSGSLLMKQKEWGRQLKSSSKLFTGFAPSYEKPKVSDANSKFIAYREGNLRLNFNKDEVKYISDIAGDNVYLDRYATEATFKKVVSNYQIVHLAMHAYPNKDEPEKSALLFASVPSSDKEDGVLHAYEFHEFDLNAYMVVLSACETGYGKLMNGEGALSLGYAFASKGVPSIVASHWKVDDETTPKLMGFFYENLKKGFSKDIALSLAKRSFLEKYGKQYFHPYYWAAFTLSGDDAKIKMSSKNPIYLISLILLSICLVLAFFLKNRKKITDSI